MTGNISGYMEWWWHAWTRNRENPSDPSELTWLPGHLVMEDNLCNIHACWHPQHGPALAPLPGVWGGHTSGLWGFHRGKQGVTSHQDGWFPQSEKAILMLDNYTQKWPNDCSVSTDLCRPGGPLLCWGRITVDDYSVVLIFLYYFQLLFQIFCFQNYSMNTEKVLQVP